MLNLWKKIQEKGRISSPKKNVDVVNFGPQYDGPLKSFSPDSCDFLPLEKCRLLLNGIDDIYDNKTAYFYFKSFLEVKMAEPLLHLYNSLVFGDRSNFSNDINEDKSLEVQNGSQPTIDVNIFNEMLSTLPEDIRSRILINDVKIVENNSNINLAVVSAVLQDILLDYWTEFIHSEWYFKYQVDLLTSRSVTLGDILGHETAISYLKQFLETESCSNIVEFWIAASNFKQFAKNCFKSEQVDVEQISNDAIALYEKYLSLLATCPLGFNDIVRSAVEEAICDEANGPHVDSFDPAVNTVLAFLRKYYLVPFLSSQHYVHLLSDLIRYSCSLVNHSPTSSVSDYCTDSKRSLLPKLDPDTVWKDRKRNGLRLGHVDQLGRFQSDIEPDPDRITKSKISWIMQKLVQKSANKVEEELAWQVAEMVIKDITDLTMGGGADSFETENGTKMEK